MKAVVQIVENCSLETDGEVLWTGRKGLLIYLGVHKGDTDTDVSYTLEKCRNLRIFEDENGKMNRSACDLGLDFIVISQFTLYGNTRKGRRPSYNDAAPPELAENLYIRFIEGLRDKGSPVYTGKFGAKMMVSYTNCGPVTVLVDSGDMN